LFYAREETLRCAMSRQGLPSIGTCLVPPEQNLRNVRGKAGFPAVDDDRLGIGRIALRGRQAVRDERSRTACPVTVLDWLVDGCSGQRADHIVAVTMFLPPTRPMSEKKFRQIGIAPENGEVQSLLLNAFPVGHHAAYSIALAKTELYLEWICSDL